VQTFVEPMAASFGDDEVRLEFQPMGRLTRSLADGFAADVVVVTEEVLAKLGLQGAPVARVGVGVGVREGARLPDLSTPEAFKQALLAARSVTYMDPHIGTSGKHVAEVLDRLGIARQVGAKAKLGQGGAVAEFVASGEIELAIHQISEILAVKGVRLAGPLPAPLQKLTTYVAARRSGAPAAAAFIAHLTSPRARQRLAPAGYTSPE